MGRLGDRFRDLSERGETALVTFVTAGDPDLETTEALVLSMAEAGADAIEIGVPFSDPVGEGPTIQRASERALASGTSLRKVLELVRRLRPRVEIPLGLMGYANNRLAMGERRFAEAAAEVGVDGLIVVDLPPEEGERFFDEVRAAGIDPILLAAPTTTRERLEFLAKETRGFLYYVSVTGVTGARSDLSSTLEEEVASVRSVSDVTLCVGFGVSTPEHARRVGAFADGVVVGSALVSLIETAATPDEAVEAVASRVAELKQPLR